MSTEESVDPWAATPEPVKMGWKLEERLINPPEGSKFGRRTRRLNATLVNVWKRILDGEETIKVGVLDIGTVKSLRVQWGAMRSGAIEDFDWEELAYPLQFYSTMTLPTDQPGLVEFWVTKTIRDAPAPTSTAAQRLNPVYAHRVEAARAFTENEIEQVQALARQQASQEQLQAKREFEAYYFEGGGLARPPERTPEPANTPVQNAAPMDPRMTRTFGVAKMVKKTVNNLEEAIKEELLELEIHHPGRVYVRRGPSDAFLCIDNHPAVDQALVHLMLSSPEGMT